LEAVSSFRDCEEEDKAAVPKADAKDRRRQFVVIQGPPGSGKSSIASKLQKWVHKMNYKMTNRHGIFLRQKFDMSFRGDMQPYAIIIALCEELCVTIWGWKHQGNQQRFGIICNKILQEFGNTELSLLANSIPTLQTIVSTSYAGKLEFFKSIWAARRVLVIMQSAANINSSGLF